MGRNRKDGQAERTGESFIFTPRPDAKKRRKKRKEKIANTETRKAPLIGPPCVWGEGGQFGESLGGA